MEIEVIKNKYEYRYDICPNCNSELRIKKSTICYNYIKGHNIANIICPCCSDDFIIYECKKDDLI